MIERTLDVTDFERAKARIPDVVGFGDTNLFKLLSKASSESQGWMKSTKAMEIPGVGCVVQVTTQQADSVAEALVFVPGVRIVQDKERDVYKLVGV